MLTTDTPVELDFRHAFEFARGLTAGQPRSLPRARAVARPRAVTRRAKPRLATKRDDAAVQPLLEAFE